MACLSLRQTNIWSDAGILSTGSLWTNFSDVLIRITQFSFNNIHSKISSAKRWPFCLVLDVFTHLGRVTHICVSNLTIIGWDNGLSPGRRQAIILTNDGILLIGPLETNFSEILIGIQTFSIKKMHLKMSSVKRRPFCLVLDVLMTVTIQPCGVAVSSVISWLTESVNPMHRLVIPVCVPIVVTRLSGAGLYNS